MTGNPVVPVVHAVTNDEVLLRDGFLQQAKSVMGVLGARGAVHLRARWLPARRLYELALWLAGWERETGCWAVINDRLDVACAAGAGAVQLTTRSIRPADARLLDPDVRIGASVHTTREAITAEAEGADWCIAGSAFETNTHPGETPGGLELLQGIGSAVGIPVIAIGGVTPELVPQLTAAGIHGAATISGVWNASDVGEAAQRYLSAYGANGGAD